MMEGLLSQATQPTEAQPTETNQAEGLTDEQIAQLKQAKQVSSKIIYNQAVFAAIIKQLDQADPVEALATAIVKVLTKTEAKVGDMDIAVVFALGIALIYDVAEAIAQTGREPFTDEQVASALEMGIKMWLDANRDRVDDEDLKQKTLQLQQHVGGQ